MSQEFNAGGDRRIIYIYLYFNYFLLIFRIGGSSSKVYKSKETKDLRKFKSVKPKDLKTSRFNIRIEDGTLSPVGPRQRPSD